MLARIFVFLSAAKVILAVPQGVTSAIAPAQSPPLGCYENYDGSFLIGPVNVTSQKRDLQGRETELGITLKNGVLTDPQGRTGYVASNQQFQFDDPPQAGAIWTGGFSVCTNNRLTLGNDDIWWKCESGSFYNLYFKSIGGQCIESYLITRPEPGSGGVIQSGSPGTQSTATTPAESKTSAQMTSTSKASTTSDIAGTIGGTARTTDETSASNLSEKPTETATRNGGLAPAVKIGIGVGVGVGAGGILLAVVIFLCLRRRLSANAAPTEAQNLSEKRELEELPAGKRFHELVAGRGQLPEMPVKERPQELPTER